MLSISSSQVPESNFFDTESEMIPSANRHTAWWPIFPVHLVLLCSHKALANPATGLAFRALSEAVEWFLFASKSTKKETVHPLICRNHWIQSNYLSSVLLLILLWIICHIDLFILDLFLFLVRMTSRALGLSPLVLRVPWLMMSVMPIVCWEVTGSQVRKPGSYKLFFDDVHAVNSCFCGHKTWSMVSLPTGTFFFGEAS